MRDVEIIPISIPRLNAGDPGRWAGGKLVCSTETSGNGGEWDSHTHPSQHEIIMSGKYNISICSVWKWCISFERVHCMRTVWGWCVSPTYNWRSRKNYTGLNLDGKPTTVKNSAVFCFVFNPLFKTSRSGIGILPYFLFSLNTSCHVLSLVSSGFCSCRK